MPRPTTPTELHGNEQFSGAFKPRSQTYSLTHITPTDVTRTDWERESYMDRSFISFSFGGRWIEDWSLIATFPDGRLQRAGSAEFEDLTTTYEVIDGQFYWGTHFVTNTLELSLATDGMTQRQLDDFKRWFSAGHVRELILAEHPNRAIMARISAPPVIYVLPFEEKTTIRIAGRDYKTSTTLYKGEISVSFVMDDPFWYSKSNVLGEFTNEDGQQRWKETWTNANNETALIFEDADAIKVILEDNIPISGMFSINTYLGGDVFAQSNYTLAAPDEAAGTGHGNGGNSSNKKYAEINNSSNPPSYGFLGPLMKEQANSFLTKDEPSYLFYGGNAPSYPIIEFTITPSFNELGYIDSPSNSFATSNDAENNYDSIVFESVSKQSFDYSLPAVYLAYNQAIDLFTNTTVNTSLDDLRKLIRDKVNHRAAREWAIWITDSLRTGNNYDTMLTEINRPLLINNMKYFLLKRDGTPYDVKCSFNCKNGISTGEFYYRLKNNDNPALNTSQPTVFANRGIMLDREGEPRVIESIGDMMVSGYIKLEDTNYPDKEGLIRMWSDESDITRAYSHKISINSKNDLQNFLITYKYMYY